MGQDQAKDKRGKQEISVSYPENHPTPSLARRGIHFLDLILTILKTFLTSRSALLGAIRTT